MVKRQIRVGEEDIRYNLYNPEEFQRQIDAAFEHIFMIPNRKPDGASHVEGVIDLTCKSDDDGFLFVKPGTDNRIFRGFCSYKTFNQVYDHARNRNPIIIFRKVGQAGPSHEELKKAKIEDIVRKECFPAFGHEMQHLTWDILRPGQRDEVLAQVKARLPDFQKYVDQMKGVYPTMSGHPLELRTADEMLAEMRRLTMLETSNALIGYVKDDPDGFRVMSALIPVMDELTKNYAFMKYLQCPEEAFNTRARLKGVKKMTYNDEPRHHALINIEDTDPFNLGIKMRKHRPVLFRKIE